MCGVYEDPAESITRAMCPLLWLRKISKRFLCNSIKLYNNLLDDIKLLYNLEFKTNIN